MKVLSGYWNDPVTNQKFKLRSVFIHAVSFNGNSSLQVSKAKNIETAVITTSFEKNCVLKTSESF